VKICANCQARFDQQGWLCPSCAFSPELSPTGIVFTAPEIAEEGDGFRPEYFDELAQLESGNFWFRARNQLILATLRKHFPAMASFLEVGCGTGYVLSAIANEFPSARLVGSEAFRVGLAFAQSRLPRVEFLQMDARRVPYECEFEVVAAFDVLEHIHEDNLVLLQLSRAIVPGGGLVLTVPQHAWFWSYQDDLACHVRRYSVADLIYKVQQAGFEVVDTISFVSLLFPLMWVSRRVRRLDDSHRIDALADMRINPLLSFLLGAVMRVEKLLIGLGLRFSFGGSLLLVAKKRTG
jgi:SAM-dependent methyltransferase